MLENHNTSVSLYVVMCADKTYFAGYDTTKGRANFVVNPLEAKKFTNKFDIKLRPEEMLVEITVDLAKVETSVSEPFRPHRRTKSN